MLPAVAGGVGAHPWYRPSPGILAGVKRLTRARPSCPRCGSSDVIRIAYGYPAPELVEASERGEVELGGCCIEDGLPDWRCRSCGGGFDHNGPCAEREW